MAVFSSLTLLDQWIATYRRSFDTGDHDVSVLVVAAKCADHELSRTLKVDVIETFLAHSPSPKRLILCTYNSLPKVGAAVQSAESRCHSVR